MNKATYHILLSVLLFSIVNACVKYLGHIPFYELVFFRALITLVSAVFILKRMKISIWGNNKKLLILRGLAGTIALTMFFYTLQNMPLASAVTIQYMSPIFTILLAIFLTQEKPRMRQVFYFIIAFIGVICIKGFDLRVSTLELILGLSAALFSAFAYNFVRMLNKSDNEHVVVFYFPLVTLPLVSPVVFYNWVWPFSQDWPIIILMGVFTHIAQVYMTKAYQAERAANISIYKYVGVLMALSIGYYLFDEKISWLSLVGIVLIIFSVWRSSKKV